MKLTDAELRQLRPALVGCPDWVTPATLICAWRDFVTEVEHGYEEPSYEYVNELGNRDVLEKLLSIASGSVQAELTSFIMPLDARFNDATRQLDRCLASDCGARQWWWFRIPRKLEDTLRDDLIALDLI